MASVNKLLHPELLSEEELLSILQARCVNVHDLHRMNREQLIELFRRVATPLGQRVHKVGWRGKLTNDSREQCNIHDNNRLAEPVTKRSSDSVNTNAKRVKLESQANAQTTRVKLKRPNMNACVNGYKESEQPPVKKPRQPVTWP